MIVFVIICVVVVFLCECVCSDFCERNNSTRMVYPKYNNVIMIFKWIEILDYKGRMSTKVVVYKLLLWC